MHESDLRSIVTNFSTYGYIHVFDEFPRFVYKLYHFDAIYSQTPPEANSRVYTRYSTFFFFVKKKNQKETHKI